MSAATPTIQEAPGSRPLGAALVAVSLAIALLLALVASQQAGSQMQVLPAAGTAPVVHDHGWVDATYKTGPAIRGFEINGAAGGGLIYTGIPYAAPAQDGTGGANGTRFAQ